MLHSGPVLALVGSGARLVRPVTVTARGYAQAVVNYTRGAGGGRP
jgi:hypothetical protein